MDSDWPKCENQRSPGKQGPSGPRIEYAFGYVFTWGLFCQREGADANLLLNQQ
jgi:hypothetical protein